MRETQPAVPSLEKARPWGPGAVQSIAVNALDRGWLEQVVNLSQLASESAREVLLPMASHRVTVVLKDLNAEVRTLVSSGRVGAARALLEASSGAEELRWATVLAPPSTRSEPGTGRSDFSRNAAWLRSNQAAFAEMWVALSDGQLVDHDRSRVALHRRLEAAGKLSKGTLFTKVG